MERLNNFLSNERAVGNADLLKESIARLKVQIDEVINSDEPSDAEKKERVEGLRKTLSGLQQKVARERTLPKIKRTR